MGKQRRQSMAALKALAGATVKFARAQVVLDKTEAALEKEIERERTSIPKTKLAKVRCKGEHLLHSKQILLAVVLLNIIDCMLVLGELMLDIKYVTDLLTLAEIENDDFIASMKTQYPSQLGYLGSTDIHTLYTQLTSATINWDDDVNTTDVHSVHRRAAQVVSTSNLTNTVSIGHRSHHHQHTIEEQVAHGLHKASITILAILVLETFFKIFCIGPQMKEHKLECFDAVIVVASFILDLVFIQGLQQFDIQEFVLILAFLVPWRVIRVVNSLVVAIMDHEHFRLKLLYKQKKTVSNELRESKTELKGLEAALSALEKMCLEAGIPSYHVKAKLNMLRKVTAKNNLTGAFAGFAVGGEAMGKPLPVRSDVVKISIPEENHNTEARDLELIMSANQMISPTDSLVGQSTELAETIALGENKSGQRPTTDNTPRSLSSSPHLQPSANAPRIEELAVNSSSFITTINEGGDNPSGHTELSSPDENRKQSEKGEHSKL